MNPPSNSPTIHHYSGQSFKKRAQKPAGVSQEFLVTLYRDMLRIRMIECEIEAQYHKDQMKTPIHLVIGQEATSVGACAALKRTDQIWSTHRTHGNYLAKGGDFKAMLAEMFCRITGCAASRGGSMHLVDFEAGVAGTSAIVAGILPIAVGAALTAQYKKSDLVNLVCFGDAATEEGGAHEAFNFAVLKKLPIVFFCENNFYSVCSPFELRQPAIEIWKRSAGYGMPSVLIDGTNVLDVFEATQEAVDRARRGGGPTFIEAKVCRYRGHGGAGDDSHTGYRSIEEVKEWQTQADPLESYFQYLSNLKLIDGATVKKMEAEIQKEILEAFEYAANSPNPTAADLMTHVYCEERHALG